MLKLVRVLTWDWLVPHSVPLQGQDQTFDKDSKSVAALRAVG